MRSYLLMHKRKWVSLIMSVIVFAYGMAPSGALSFREISGLIPGSTVWAESRQISNGFTYETWRGVNAGGRPAVYRLIGMDAGNAQTRAIAWSGSSVTERLTLSAMVAQARGQGLNVVGGINGDFFNLASGAPIGLLIKRGELLSSDGSYSNAIGFRADGSTVIGNPELRFNILRNGNAIGTFAFNKQAFGQGIFAYNRAYGARAGTLQNGVDIVINTSASRLTLGGFIEGVVAEIRPDTQGTPIGENQIIVSALEDTAGYTALASIIPGDRIRLEAGNPDGQWLGVTEAIGGLQRLISNGAVVPGLSTVNVHPSTLIGRKPDGDILALSVDGRQAEWSNGISFQEGAQLLLALGATDAIVLDGGGSTVVSARLPGETASRTLSRPSDGAERAISNALLFVSNTLPVLTPDPNTGLQSSEAASLLHLYPASILALPGASVNWRVLATDAGFHPAGTPFDLTWSSSGGIFSPNGTMTVAGAPGQHIVNVASSQSSGSARIIIPERLSEIRISTGSVSLKSGTSIDINARAFVNGAEVSSADSSFSWSVDPHVGVVDSQGVLIATGEAGAAGTLRVSWNGVSSGVAVSIAREPVEIENFEELPTWQAVGIRAAGAAARTIPDTSLALFGDGVLRVFYDFRPRSADDAGTAGVVAGPSGPDAADGSKTFLPKTLEGSPSGVGVWVYGNNSRHWLRARIMDANGREVDIDYTSQYNAATGEGGIDWTGWKYVDAAIPGGLTAPYTLTAPIRIMSPQEELKSMGTLLFDRFRAVYGMQDDDLTKPDISAVWPADGSAVRSGTITITSRTYDEAGGSGLNPERVRMTLNGAQIENLTITEEGGGLRVSAPQGATVPLAGGMHVATLHMKDNFGNKSTRTWSFHVDTATPQLMLVAPPEVSSGATFDAAVRLRTPNPLKGFDLEIRWDPKVLEPVDMNPRIAGIQMGMEKVVADAKVLINEADAAAGSWRFSVSEVNSTIRAAERQMLTLRFRVRVNASGESGIAATGSMQTAGLAVRQSFSFPNTGFEAKHAYQIDVRGMAAGGNARISVTDRMGSPIAGATIFVGGAGTAAITNSSGVVTTPAIGALGAGRRTTVQAIRNGLSSQVKNVVVGEGSGSAAPRGLTVSPISRPGGMSVNWLSTASGGTSVQVVETALYRGSFGAEATRAAADVTATVITHPASGERLFSHKAVFYELKPGTEYKFLVHDGNNGRAPVGDFRTPVSQEGSTFTFGFVTDSRATDAASAAPLRDTVGRMLGQAPELSFIIHGGDLVSDGSNAMHWWGVFETAGIWLRNVPFLAVPGDREFRNDERLSNYRAFWGLPATGPSSLGERAYTLLNGDARFYMLDTEADIDRQLQWLEVERKASDAKWHIVVMHRGIYGGAVDEAALRGRVGPVLESLDIDLVLSGNDRVWTRTTMREGRKAVLGAGVTHISGGSTGTAFDNGRGFGWTDIAYDGNTPSFTLVTVSPDSLKISASHISGATTVRHDLFTILSSED